MSENLLTRELAALHETYVVAVNQAVEADDLVLVDELAQEYDRDALELMTEWRDTTAA